MKYGSSLLPKVIIDEMGAEELVIPCKSIIDFRIDT